MYKNMMKSKNIRYTYQPGAYTNTKFPLSRSAVDEYLECKKCFYTNRRLGLKKPSQIPFNLNSAVDNLFKNEFDKYRREKRQHPLMEKYGINAIPYTHAELDIWRQNFQGVRVDFIGTDIEVFGAVDDLWIYENGDIIVVDYKSTSKSSNNVFHPINDFSDVWEGGKIYKRQLEIYQWILFNKGFQVSNDCFLVYANAFKDKQEFNNVLDFQVTVLKHVGDFSWVEGVLIEIYKLLNSNEIPEPSSNCDLCGYVEYSNQILL